MAETVRLDEQFYIVAETERSTTPLRVLKHGDSFAVFDPHGDITPATSIEQGLYHTARGFSRGSSCCWAGAARCSSIRRSARTTWCSRSISRTPISCATATSSCLAGKSTSCARVCCGMAATANAFESPTTRSTRSRCPSRFISTPITPTCSKRVGRPGPGGVAACRTVAVRSTSSATSASMVSSAGRLSAGASSRTGWRKGRRSFWWRSIGMREQTWN